MDFLVLSTLVGIIVSAVISSYVFGRNTSHPLNRNFFILGIAVSVWGCGILLRYNAGSESAAVVFFSVAMFGSMWTVGWYFRFARVFMAGILGEAGVRRMRGAEAAVFASGALIMAGIPVFGAKSMALVGGHFHSVTGPIFFAAVVWGIATVLLGVFMILAHMKDAPGGLERKHMLTVALAPLMPAVIFGVLELGLHATSADVFVGEPYFTIAIFELVIGWGVMRLGLMTISPQSAALHILQSLPDGLVLLDSRGIVRNANPAFLEMTGLRREVEAEGRPVSDFLEGSLPCAESAAPCAAKDLSFNVRHSSGQGIPVSANLRQVRDPASGARLGTVMVLRDLRARMKMEAELVHAEKLAGLGRLAAGMAHEINNPLSVMMGLSELGNLLGLGGKAEEYFRKIHAQALRTKSLMGKLLLLSRKEEGRREETDLNDLIEEALDLASLGMDPGGITVEKELRRGMPSVECDPEMMRQVFVNLAQNAFQAVAECGCSGHVRVTSGVEGGTATVRFEDSGHGIPPEAMPMIFDPFFTTKAVGKGTGLGLSICHGIVEKHGGRISAENRPEGGARFTVELPAKSCA